MCIRDSLDALLDVEAIDLFAFRAGLDRDERRSEHLCCELAHALFCGFDTPSDPVRDDVDTAHIGMLLEPTLATPTGVDLRLDDNNRIAALLDQRTDGCNRLVHGHGNTTDGDSDAAVGHQRLRLVLMDLQEDPPQFIGFVSAT